MSRRIFWLAAFFLWGLQPHTPATPQATAARPPHATRLSGLARPPLFFELIDKTTALVRVGDASAAIDASGAALVSPSDAGLRLRFVNANPQSTVSCLEPLQGRAHHFRGSDPRGWLTDVAMCARLRLSDIYPDVDIVYYEADGRLEYDFVVRTGAAIRDIAFRLEGGDDLRLDRDGDLIVRSNAGELRQHRPVVYEITPSGKTSIPGTYVIRPDRSIGFDIVTSGRDATIVIDPIVTYSSYVGGTGTDAAVSMAVDGAGHIYLTGYTQSQDFPATGGAATGSRDAFVLKLNPDASQIVYAAYIGGSGGEKGTAIAVDAAGSAYIAGETSSPDFPTTAGAFDRTCGDGSADDCGRVYQTKSTDAFVAKLAGDGRLVYSTFLGGRGADTVGYNGDSAGAMTVDGSGHVYVAGSTSSADFPTSAGAFDRTCGTDGVCNGMVLDAFVAKVNPSGSALVYSTFVGSSKMDAAYDLAIDSNGHAFVTGETSSSDFPLANPIQQSGGGSSDAFLVRVDAAGSSLLYSTYLGGAGSDSGIRVAVDPGGDIVVAGTTTSPNFPVLGAIQRTYTGASSAPWMQGNAFITRLAPRGDSIVFSTYYGGGGTAARGIALDASSSLFVAGPTRGGAGVCGVVLGELVPCLDSFVVTIDRKGRRVWEQTFGGSGDDAPRAIAVTPGGRIVVAGATASSDLASKGSLQTSYRGNGDAFVAMLSAALTVVTTGGGRVTSTPSGLDCGALCTLAAGSAPITLNAEPSPGFVFAGWGGDADCLDGHIVLTADRACTASFVAILPEPPRAGSLDLNGDRSADVFSYDPRTGARSLELSDRRGGFHSIRSTWSPDWTIRPADFNGDGLADLLLYRAGSWMKALNNGRGDFEYVGGAWDAGWSISVADLDGDGRSDAFLYSARTGAWVKAYTTDPRADFRYVSGSTSPGMDVYPLDFDGDRRTDFFLYCPSTGDWVSLVNDTDNALARRGGRWTPGWQVSTGDFNNDGRSDLFLFDPQTGGWRLGTGIGGEFWFSSGEWEPGWALTVTDFDGDGRADVFGYSAATGAWMQAMNLDGRTFACVRGLWSPEWEISTGDFNGDRRGDLLLYNRRTGQWFQTLFTGPGAFAYASGAWAPGLTIISTF